MREILNDFFMKCKMMGLAKETIDFAHKIFEQDPNLDPLDVLHFSTAICSKCNSFIFMDSRLKNSKIINDIAKEQNIKLVPFDTEKNEDKGSLDRESTWLQ